MTTEVNDSAGLPARRESETRVTKYRIVTDRGLTVDLLNGFAYNEAAATEYFNDKAPGRVMTTWKELTLQREVHFTTGFRDESVEPVGLAWIMNGEAWVGWSQ